MQRQREGCWLNGDPKSGLQVRGQRERSRPLEQGAGALLGQRGRGRGAVTHGQDVVVAGVVAVAGKVVGLLGETGCHSVWTLKNADSRLCEGELGTERGR